MGGWCRVCVCVGGGGRLMGSVQEATVGGDNSRGGQEGRLEAPRGLQLLGAPLCGWQPCRQPPPRHALAPLCTLPWVPALSPPTVLLLPPPTLLCCLCWLPVPQVQPWEWGNLSYLLQTGYSQRLKEAMATAQVWPAANLAGAGCWPGRLASRLPAHWNWTCLDLDAQGCRPGQADSPLGPPAVAPPILA